MTTIGTNFLSNNYWNLPHTVDISYQAEPPFLLPRKVDGGDDWDNAVGIATAGRKFSNYDRVRSTILTNAERLFCRHIAFLYRGQGDVTIHDRQIINAYDDLKVHGISTKALVFASGTGQITYSVQNAIDFELVGVVEVDNFSSWLGGDIVHPVMQAIWSQLQGYRRVMDWCGLESTLPSVDQGDRYTWSDFTYRPGRLRRIEEMIGQNYTHGSLALIPKIMRKHREGKYWISLPMDLDLEGLAGLGEMFRDVINESDVVEAGNELWNYSFENVRRWQARCPVGMHLAEFYIRDAMRVINGFEIGLGRRCKRVACWQSTGNGSWAFGKDWDGIRPSLPYVYSNVQFFDALGIAPYLFNDARPINESEFIACMIDLVARCRAWKNVADQHGKPLYGYEGLIEAPGEHNRAARDSIEMADWIHRYLNQLMPYFSEFCIYTAMGPSWGVIEGRGMSYARASGILRYLNDRAPTPTSSFLQHMNKFQKVSDHHTAHLIGMLDQPGN